MEIMPQPPGWGLSEGVTCAGKEAPGGGLAEEARAAPSGATGCEIERVSAGEVRAEPHHD